MQHALGLLPGSTLQCGSMAQVLPKQDCMSLQRLASVVCCTGPRNKKVASIVPKAGRALLHRHGDCCLEHEAAPVTSGLKYILRTDVCFAAG